MTPEQYSDLGKIAIVILVIPLIYYGAKAAIKLLEVKKKENPMRLARMIRAEAHDKCHRDQLKNLRALTDELLKIL